MQTIRIKKRTSTGSYDQEENPQKTEEDNTSQSSFIIEEENSRPKKALIKEFDIPNTDMENIIDGLYDRLAVARRINSAGAMEIFFNRFEVFYWTREILISKNVQYSLSYLKFKLQKAMTTEQEKSFIEFIENKNGIGLSKQEKEELLWTEKERLEFLWQETDNKLEKIFNQISSEKEEDAKIFQSDNLAGISEDEWKKYKFIWQKSEGLFDIVASNDTKIIWQIINAIDNTYAQLPLLIALEIQPSYSSDWNKIIKPAVKNTLEKIWNNEMPKL